MCFWKKWWISAGSLACTRNDVWQSPEIWLKSDLTRQNELEMMWGQIQQELKTKGNAHGNDWCTGTETARRPAGSVPGARYQTGLVIDLNGPAGSIFYFMGVCNRLVRELMLSAQLKREYKTEINSAADYQSHLTVMQKWFGIVFVE